MFLNQVVLVGGIPFSVTVPKPPADIDVTQMTEAQLHAKLHMDGIYKYLEHQMFMLDYRSGIHNHKPLLITVYNSLLRFLPAGR